MTDERVGGWILGDLLANGDFAEVRAASGGAVVKRLHAHAARLPAMRELFEAEAELTCTLPSHPHVVRGLTALLAGDRPGFAMTRVVGADLRARLGTALASGEVRTIVAAAARAAAHLHAHGWVHGDLGPANLLVGPDAIVVCDLGVARRTDTAGPVRGTAAYMAPEQVRGEAWTGAVDVFALGVLAWELSAGARLFHRGARYLSMAAVVEDTAPPLADAALASLVARALAKDPTARPGAAELADALVCTTRSAP